MALPSQGTVLDIGSGSSPYLDLLAADGREVIAVDLADLLLGDLASTVSRHDNLRIICADVRMLPLKSASIDFILMAGPLYHLPDFDQRISALREAYRVLKVHGCALVVGLNRTGVLSRKIFETPATVLRALRYMLSPKAQLGHLPAGSLGDFPDAHLSSAKALTVECQSVGFRVEEHWGAQGGLAPLYHLVRLSARVSPSVYRAISWFAIATARSGRTLAFSEHFVLRLRK
jgi:ubiquinone/menaquinone biosynthesis C-methylase UbiE